MPTQEMTSGTAAVWGMILLTLVGSAVASYLLGCVNGAVIVSKYILHDDVRNHGSGNAGLSNFHRIFGGKLTAVVLALDVAKMVLAVALSVALPSVLLGAYAGIAPLWQPPVPWTLLMKYWAGSWCLLGHMFPCTFGFKGGKGILSGGTLAFLIDWRMGLITIGLFLVIVALTRYISLGSICAAASFPVSTVAFVTRNMAVVALAGILALLVIWMHRSNIRRLAAGNEAKFSLHRREKP